MYTYDMYYGYIYKKKLLLFFTSYFGPGGHRHRWSAASDLEKYYITQPFFIYTNTHISEHPCGTFFVVRRLTRIVITLIRVDVISNTILKMICKKKKGTVNNQ